MELRQPRQAAAGILAGRSPLLALASDEKLIALIRAGNEAAFDQLFDRYRARLTAFCRHMLSSREDAEDVMQEVFVNAYNAMRADEREINARPWLYRIARNRCLNHLRKHVPDGRDTMDEFVGAGGVSTADIVHKRADLRNLLRDVQKLPETQRTALLMREIDVLSYGQIAEAMETTVPSVKSLLVRARMSLAEATQARALSCDDVRMQLAEVQEGLRKVTAPLKRHVRECEDCRAYKKSLRKTNTAMAMALSVGPLMIFKKLIAAKLGLAAISGAQAGGGAAATGTTAVAGSVAAGAGGTAATAGVGAVVTKAAVGLALTALVAGGVVEANKKVHRQRAHQAPAAKVAPPAAGGGVSAAEVEVVERKEASEATDAAVAEEDTATAPTDGDSTTATGEQDGSQTGDGEAGGGGPDGSGDDIVTGGGPQGSGNGGTTGSAQPEIVPSTGDGSSPSGGAPTVDP